MSSSSRHHTNLKFMNFSDEDIHKEILRLYRTAPRYSKSRIKVLREILLKRKKAAQLLLKE